MFTFCGGGGEPLPAFPVLPPAAADGSKPSPGGGKPGFVVQQGMTKEAHEKIEGVGSRGERGSTSEGVRWHQPKGEAWKSRA